MFLLDAQKSLDIYLNTNDCINCNNIFTYVKKIDKSITKNLYLSKENQEITDDILKNYELKRSDFNISYLPSDFFNCKSNCPLPVYPSYCTFYQNQRRVDSFLLKLLPQKVPVLNKSVSPQQNNSKNTKEEGPKSGSSVNKSPPQPGTSEDLSGFQIPDSIKFSSQAELFVNDTIINILDRLLKKNVTLFVNSNYTKIKKIIILKSESFKPGVFMRLNCFDTAFYRGCYPMLTSLAGNFPKIESAYITDSTIKLMLGVTYPRYPNLKTTDSLMLQRNKKFKLTDTIMDSKYFIYSKNFITNKNNLTCIENNSFSDGKYWLLSLPFYFNNNKLYVSIRSLTQPNDPNFLVELNPGMTWNYSRIIENTLKPDIQQPKNYVLNRVLNPNFYFANTIPYFLDFKKNEEFLFNKEDFMDQGKQFYITDVVSYNNKMYVLVNYGNSLVRFILDPKTKKVLEKNKIADTKESERIHIRFITHQSYLIMDGKKFYVIQ